MTTMLEQPAGGSRPAQVGARLRPNGALAVQRPLSPWIRAVRPHQWVKATLVATAPLVALHFGFGLIARLFASLVLACAAASGTYLLNDTVDASADRQHPTKRLRPIAAGEIRPSHALAVAVVLLIAAPTLGLVLGVSTCLALGTYVVITVAYSTKLKQIPIIDITTIATGFVVRVLIGATATSTPVSPWFLTAVGAAAIMVATGKRRGELSELGAAAAAHRSSLHTYQDAVTIKLLFGAAGALGAAMIAWAMIGNGGPQLEEVWAIILVVPVVTGVARYLRLAVAGLAAKPEHLIRDRVLQASALGTAIVFFVGRVTS